MNIFVSMTKKVKLEPAHLQTFLEKNPLYTRWRNFKCFKL